MNWYLNYFLLTEAKPYSHSSNITYLKVFKNCNILIQNICVQANALQWVTFLCMLYISPIAGSIEIIHSIFYSIVSHEILLQCTDCWICLFWASEYKWQTILHGSQFPQFHFKQGMENKVILGLNIYKIFLKVLHCCHMFLPDIFFVLSNSCFFQLQT